MPFTTGPGAAGGAASVIILDEGSAQGTASGTAIFDFVGAGVAATFSGGTATITVSGGTAAGSLIIQDEGSTIGTATVLNFVGSGATASFSSGTATATISGGSEVGYTAWCMTSGVVNNGTVTGGNLGINGGTFMSQVVVPAPLQLRSLQYRNQDTATARSMEWGLYKDTGGGTATRVASGTDSFTPSAASNRTSAAASAPVSIDPGVYWLLTRNTGGATNFQMAIQTTTDAQIGLIGIATKTLGSNLGATEDLTTGWTRTSVNILVAALRGSILGEGSAF